MKVAEKQEQNLHFDICNKLVSGLMEEASLVQAFKGKWVIIRNKLQLLPTHLTDLSDFPNFDSNVLCSELLKSISETLGEGMELAKKCRSHDQDMGKLQMQSDVDLIAMKINQHVQDCELLIKSGVLCESANCSRSKQSSKRETIRVEARNLLTSLQIGNFESKNTAMDSLLGLIQEDDKNVLIAVAQGTVPVLVQLLDSCFVDLKEKAVSAVSRISQVENCKHVLVAEGVLSHLLRILESGSGFAKEKACLALQSLSFSSENTRTIGSRSAIAALVEICEIGTPGAQALAAGVLRNLGGIPQIKQRFVEENAVAVLIALFASGTAMAKENSVGCLMNLVAEDESLKLLVVREGGVQCLQNFWDGASMAKSQEIAVGFLRSLCNCRPIADLLISAGFLPRLANALNWGVSAARIQAAIAVSELASLMKNKKEIGQAGVIPPLIRMLEAKAVAEKETAAQALSLLLVFSGNRRVFRKDERGIAGAVQLLHPSIGNLQKKYPISILLSVSQSAKCRKQMVSAGACGFLKKLVDMEIDGAKKLHEILVRGKLWNLFART